MDGITNCLRCPLAATRRHVVAGRGNPEATLLFVGEGPGRDEDEQGRAFVGRSGKLLDRALAELGVEGEYYITNTVRCRPPNNRDPLPTEIQACSIYLLDELPRRNIVALGKVADRTLTGLGIAHDAVWHPAYVLRSMGRYDEWLNQLRSVL